MTGRIRFNGVRKEKDGPKGKFHAGLIDRVRALALTRPS
jgi:hypothetical protein